MEIIINPFGDPSLHEVEREKAEVDSLHSKIESYPGGDIPVEVTTKNIGKGADWLVVSVIILSSATSLFFAIPAAHKKVRETLEEWDRILKEFKSLLDWLSIKKPVMMPDQYLILVALSRLDEELDASELVYLGANIIPTDNPSHQGLEDMVFNFHNESLVESVAVSRSGKILWHHSVQLPDDA